jgi:hypothetical protein
MKADSVIKSDVTYVPGQIFGQAAPPRLSFIAKVTL